MQPAAARRRPEAETSGNQLHVMNIDSATVWHNMNLLKTGIMYSKGKRHVCEMGVFQCRGESMNHSLYNFCLFPNCKSHKSHYMHINW